ncbi:MAG: phosphate ABC transporter substrate-binding protein PstS [Acidobacteriota bacterium]|nr:phosphate ABC transporter substrate-binding protein PstS [Acidobacteriota bacterium]
MKARRLLMCVLCIALAGLWLDACGGKNARSSPSGQTDQELLINVAGSTFGYPIYSNWFGRYHQLHPAIEMNYASIGSGGGIQQLRAGTVDLGASDMPLNDDLLRTFKVKILQFPTVLGAVVPTYNLPGITASLKFTPQALAGIYLGKITAWNDPAIAGPNEGVNLPAKKIIVVHRSDGSGTTFVWTDYLSKVSAQWKAEVGSDTAVRWPVGLGGKGSEGVTGIVEQTPYAIGYVELTYALQNHLLYAEVENPAGSFVEATLASVTSAAGTSSAALQKDIRVSITNAPGKGSYPVSTFTYLLVPAVIPNPAKRDAIKQFLEWMLTDGQKSAAQMSYAPLPGQVVKMETALISSIQ